MADNTIQRYEETEETIRERMLERLPENWRKEPGDFIHDAIAATPIEIQQLQINNDETLKAGFAHYAEDEDLDEHLYHIGLTRMQATPNQRNLSVDADAGVVVPKGYLASVVVLDDEANPLEYEVVNAVTFTTAATQLVEIKCLSTGAITNVPAGTEFIFVPPIPGIKQITDAGTTITARDRESNESALARYEYKLAFPDTGGNKHDYVRWSSEIPGVGKVKVISRWQDALKVKILVVDDNYEPATPDIVDDLQTHLDPGSQGIGEGKAPAGAQVFVFAAEALTINITANVVYVPEVDPEPVKAKFIEAVKLYLKSLVLPQGAPLPVSYNKIAAQLGAQPEVINFSDLLVNGGAVDVPVTEDQAPMLGAVTI